jgi:hypothetical protein
MPHQPIYNSRRGENIMNSISNCNFVGVKWDGLAIETLNTVARGLVNITELFKSQNVTIGTMLKIAAPEETGSGQQPTKPSRPLRKSRKTATSA